VTAGWQGGGVTSAARVVRRTGPTGVGALALTAVLAACAPLTPPSPSPETSPVPTSSAGSAPSSTTGVTSDPGTDPAAPSGWGPTTGELAQARGMVEAMRATDRAATVLMPGFWGYDAKEPTAAEAELNQEMHGVASARKVLKRRPHGGVFLRPEVVADADQVRDLTATLRTVTERSSGLPPLVSIDQEGGVVQRLSVGVDPVPSAASVGATGDRRYAREVARDNGRALADVGVTTVMAPVADVDPTGTSALGSRVYSSDFRAAARLVTATVKGYLDAGVLPVVKHFPGLGTVTGDSHVTLPVQTKSVRELRRTDLVPFRRAVRKGAPVVMTGHVAVEALDPGVPASASPAVVQGLLRDDLGFDGVVVTDSHGMAPIFERYGPGRGAVVALAAGNDLVLNSPNPRDARRALRAAVRSGELAEERLSEAATRVVALRLYLDRLAG
jgi:beta-N-acetylhexosaminidase